MTLAAGVAKQNAISYLCYFVNHCYWSCHGRYCTKYEQTSGWKLTFNCINILLIFTVVVVLVCLEFLPQL